MYWRIPVTLKLRAPWVVAGSKAAGAALDVELARNDRGQFVLPATLIKGNLRDACDQLVEEGQMAPDTRDVLFGTESGTRRKSSPTDPRIVANEPERGALVFGELVCEAAPENPRARTQRVQIEPEFGAAREGHLLFIECPFPFNAEVAFKGNVLFCPAERLSVTDAANALKMSLGRLFAIGGMKSIGFGRVIGQDVASPEPISAATVAAPATRLRVRYVIDRPFVVDARHHNSNLMIGSETVPGGAIKAVLARGFAMVGVEAGEFISALQIGHATPAGKRALPLSLSVSDGRLFCNLDGAPRDGHHKFALDWKSEEPDVREALGEGWEAPDITRTGSTRTAIDTETLSAAYEPGEDGGEGAGKLFSQVAVVPGETCWEGVISAPNAGGLFEQALGMLKTGLPGLGKTGAVIEAKSWESDAAPSGAALDTLDLCLTSDACLFPPYEAMRQPLDALYLHYFKDLGFELQNWFALQVLKGGYLALRYPARAGSYTPWVLTLAGSVFRLKPGNDADVDGILHNGLPPASGLAREDWETFPFLRENGFGQVALNIVDHAALSQGVRI